MFGFVFGTACLAGLFFMWRRRRWHHRYHGGPWSWRGAMRGLFMRLDTSPGQEKVLVEAVEEVMEVVEKFRGEYRASRTAIGQALRGESFDTTPLNELDVRHDALIAELRKALRNALSRIHEALDPRQRKELAELLEHGWGWGSRGAWAYAHHAGRGYGGCGWRAC